VIARRERCFVTHLAGLALVVRGNSLTEVTVSAREKPNALASKPFVARAAFLNSPAALALLTGVNDRLGASADVGPSRGVEPHALTTEPIITRASFLNSPAALVFTASLLLVVNTGSGRVGAMPVDLTVKTVIAELVGTRLAKASRRRGGVAELWARAAEVVRVERVVVEGRVPGVIVPFASAGGVGLERGVRDRVTPISHRLQSAVARVGATSAPLPKPAAVAGLSDASPRPVGTVIGLFTREAGVTLVTLRNSGFAALPEAALSEDGPELGASVRKFIMPVD